ncbi:sensor histidine kinase [Salipaludibacillus aurantiacus]|uniref:Histidine kinase-, DNA gyrase B-, and HSP90-like ATPase n=1 Tax=Salipaludibacillus aurantiacus TaxID=1601833 RepID=A0A1H9URG0_9BACI|nr:sensor histidine kinase [Salipaludibacillus aurantiacus]SES11647.1 Histidine kinase-, DNA gyrase B-, and HSP90-like ATPase [Salipaludibacillus aurantiacus]
MNLFRRLQTYFRQKKDTFTLKVFYKLLILVIIPNLLLLGVVSFFIVLQTNRMEEERFSALLALKQSLDNEIISLFDETNQMVNNVIIDEQIQETLERVNPLSTVNQESAIFGEEQYVTNDYTVLTNMRTALSSYRLSRGNIHSIAVVDLEETIFLSSTSAESYVITRGDLENSRVYGTAQSRDGGLFWSVNDALTKNRDIITFARQIPSVDQPQNIIGYALVNVYLESLQGRLRTSIDDPHVLFGLTDTVNGESIIFQDGEIVQEKADIGLEISRQLAYQPADEPFIPVITSAGDWYVSASSLSNGNELVIGYDKAVMNRELNATKTLLYSGMVILVIISLAASFKGAKIIAARLHMLSDAIMKFGKGSLDERVKLKGQDEISDIGDQFNDMAVQIRQLLTNLEEEQKHKQLFELRVLEYQLNPHFLYNTLDSINWLAIEQGQKEISEMVYGLSRLFQLILSKGKEMITVEDEVQMARYYLNIQKIRYEDRFKYDIHIDPAIKEYKISKLILQPIIENAIHHGVRKLRTEGRILITGTIEQDDVVLEVADNGVGMTEDRKNELLSFLDTEEWQEEKPEHLGYGLKNIDSRLKIVFGDSYKLRIINEGHEPFTTRIQIRIKEETLKQDPTS